MANDQAARGSAQSDAGSRHLAAPGLPACPLPGRALRSNVPRGGVDPKTVRRERPPDCPEIRKDMQEIAGKQRQFGYPLAGRRLQAIAGRWRIGVLLERKGMIMNHIGARIAKGLGDLLQGGALYRLYREEGLSVKRRGGRKRARGTRTPMPAAARPNARWSLDFLSDSFGASRKFRILAVIDDSCRENLCLMADTSISGSRVARELDELVRVYGKPGCIVSDNVLCREVLAA